MKGVQRFDTYANTFLLTGQRVVLVDASKEGSAKAVLAGLAAARVKPADVTTILVTHTHPDHVGGLAALRRATGARVVAHAADAPFVARSKPYPGPPGPQVHEPAPVDRAVADGETVDGLLVVHTPGHTPGHVSFLDRERSLLVAGDALCTVGDHGPVDRKHGVGTMDDAYNIDPAGHRASLRRLGGLEFENLVCGHGPPLLGGASAKVRAYAATL